MPNETTNQPQIAHDSDNDDALVGRVLSRREVLALFGAAGAATVLSACQPIASTGETTTANATASSTAASAVNSDTTIGCVVRPALTEGPLFVDEDLNRADIRSDPSTGEISAGIQLELTFRVSQVNAAACTPLSGIQVDVWHCDANGIYSDTNQLGFQTVGQKFLRGYQVTDESGVAQFTTIYPGWYEGRAVHIHFKMRTGDGYDFTSQLFFDDTFTDTVYTSAPYNSRGERRLRNDDDGIFRQSNGQMMLTANKGGTGYAATFEIALDLS